MSGNSDVQQQQHLLDITPSIGPSGGGETDIICNDASGLCLARTGNLKAADSGVYTTLARLASQLQQEGEGGGGASDSPPLVIIETKSSAILIREYGGQHAVAIKVPRTGKSNTGGQNE